MDLFEILFIALFILFPIMEGILKKRGKGKKGPPPTGDEADAGWSEPDEEPRSAADMVPDDLWEVMTGEERQPGEEGGAGEPGGGEASPWSSAPGETPTPAAEPDTEPRTEPVFDEGPSEPWRVEDEAEEAEPASLEYQGPEAYSLETPAPEPVVREVPSSEARHRAFHRLIDKPKRKRKRRLSPLMKALSTPDGLREAVIMKEVLGPPKGLE